MTGPRDSGEHQQRAGTCPWKRLCPHPPVSNIRRPSRAIGKMPTRNLYVVKERTDLNGSYTRLFRVTTIYKNALCLSTSLPSTPWREQKFLIHPSSFGKTSRILVVVSPQQRAVYPYFPPAGPHGIHRRKRSLNTGEVTELRQVSRSRRPCRRPGLSIRILVLHSGHA